MIYYKYVDWIQPVLSANGTMGGNSFACSASSTHSSVQPYYAFNNVTGTWDKGWTAKVSGAYLQWYNPIPIKINKLTIVNVPSSASGVGYITKYTIKASNSGNENDFVDILSGTNDVDYNKRWDIIISNKNAYKYWRIYVNGWVQEWYNINEMYITAQEAVESNSSDYDYYLYVNKPYQLYNIKRTYYKYKYQDWTQPVLTSDTSSSKIKLSATSVYGGYEMYKAFDSDTGSGYLTANGTGQGSLYVSFPNPLKISSITVKGWSNQNGYTKTIAIYSDKNNTKIIGETHTYNGNGSYTWTFSTPVETDFLSFYVIGSGSCGCIGDIKISAQERISVAGSSLDYNYYTDVLKAYSSIVRGKRSYYKQYVNQRDTGSYTFTLDKDYTVKMLFVGNGGGGSSSQRSSVWYYTGGGSGACFNGVVNLPKGTYTLTIGTLGYSYNIDNVAGHSNGVQSTDSYLTDANGNELIRVGAGKMGTGTSSGGAGGTLTLGTINVVETIKAVNGNKGGTGSSNNFAVSAYDKTKTGYGAGTGSVRYAGNVYGIAGIFDLALETDINDYSYYEDSGIKIY